MCLISLDFAAAKRLRVCLVAAADHRSITSTPCFPFAYTLLTRDCTAALESAGLDPYIGFMHRPRPGRRSLALDLMEELRAVYADRFVLSCVNRKIITAKHLQKQESGAVLLTDDGRRAFLGAWQSKKQEQITHPFLKEKIPWGLVPYCAGAPARPHSARRSGSVSAVFLEVRSRELAGT